MPVVIGIDPGAKGYLCFLDSNTKKIDFFPTPNEKTTAIQVLNWISIHNTNTPINIICVEQVHSIHGMSAKSNFNFGFNVGTIRCIADISGIGVDLVRPKAWQKEIGLPVKPINLKKAVAEAAQRLYPSVSLYGPKGGLIDGKADALMIAHYTTLKYGGLL